MKIAIMAGTPIDTEMGAKILTSYGYDDLIKIPVSKNPAEQTIFQTSSVKSKEEIIGKYILEFKIVGCNILFVYCNSLSAAVDFSKLAKRYDITVITPLQIYENIAKDSRKVLVLTANAQGLAGIEKVMFEKNKDINIVGITLLEMVKDIEKKLLPEEISNKYNFSTLGQYIDSLDVELLILGCTHFPYIEEELNKNISIPILNPTKKMVEKISYK